MEKGVNDAMKKIELDKTGTYLPAVGIGTWGMGGKFEADRSNDDEAVQAIIEAVKLGMTHIDTAEFYGNGHTEEIVGKALKHLKREDVFITSKIWPTHLNYHDAFNSIETTLRKLGTDHVDLYLIHWPPTETTVEESMEIMNSILERGYTRYIGVSNFSIQEMKKAIKSSKAPIVCNQIKYNVEDRSAEESGLIDYCKSNGISVVAYSPLNRMEISETTKEKLKTIARNHNATMVQIALAWLISKDVFVIPKSIDKSHLVENARAGEITLSKADMEMLS